MKPTEVDDALFCWASVPTISATRLAGSLARLYLGEIIRLFHLFRRFAFILRIAHERHLIIFSAPLCHSQRRRFWRICRGRAHDKPFCIALHDAFKFQCELFRDHVSARIIACPPPQSRAYYFDFNPRSNTSLSVKIECRYAIIKYFDASTPRTAPPFLFDRFHRQDFHSRRFIFIADDSPARERCVFSACTLRWSPHAFDRDHS